MKRSAIMCAVLLSSSTLAVADRPWTGLERAPERALQGVNPLSSLPGMRSGGVGDGRSNVFSDERARFSALPNAGPLLAPVPEIGPEPEASPRVDESALRFYASRGETARVAAEIRRIKLLHPDWEPPENLFDASDDTKEQRLLWSLFKEERFNEIRAYVERLRAADQSWRPSQEFIAQFERAVTRRSIVAASEIGDHAGVVDAAQSVPAILVCAEMDVLWRVAESLTAIGAAERTLELYGYILSTCTDANERVATLQKAAQVLSPDAAERLMGLGRLRADGTHEFQSVAFDLLRQRVGQAAGDPVSHRLEPGELRRFEEATLHARSSKDAEILGWFHYADREFRLAGDWFRRSMNWERNLKAIEGLALALREQGEIASAEDLTYEWRASDPLIEKLYVELMATQLTEETGPRLSEERIARFAKHINNSRSGHGAQALGWHFFNQDEFAVAKRWFELSLRDEPSESNTLGLALIAQEEKDRRALEALEKDYGARFPRVVEVAAWSRPQPATRTAARSSRPSGPSASVSREIVALYEAGRYSETIAAMERAGRAASRDRGLRTLKGWSLLRMNRAREANDVFAQLDRERSTQESQYGMHYSRQELIPPAFRDNY
jgi:tetratricopeptide (TPR) repeat protein